MQVKERIPPRNISQVNLLLTW